MKKLRQHKQLANDDNRPPMLNVANGPDGWPQSKQLANDDNRPSMLNLATSPKGPPHISKPKLSQVVICVQAQTDVDAHWLSDCATGIKRKERNLGQPMLVTTTVHITVGNHKANQELASFQQTAGLMTTPVYHICW